MVFRRMIAVVLAAAKSPVAAAGLAAVMVIPGALAAGETKEEPERFTGSVSMAGLPGGGTARIRITVKRWSTDEERMLLLEALRDGGIDGLVGAMEKIDVGCIQVDDSLGWPLRHAVTRRTEKGRVVRVATDRPILFGELGTKGGRTLDYPIGLVEFTLPAEGSGEGTLVPAAMVKFDAQGQIEVTTTPRNTGPQRLLGMKAEAPKKKSKKE